MQTQNIALYSEMIHVNKTQLTGSFQAKWTNNNNIYFFIFNLIFKAGSAKSSIKMLHLLYTREYRKK